LPEMAKLAATDPESFREKCGDGFVSSIGYGADLYLLFHFHHLNVHDRTEISFESHASAGIADIFSAKGSSTFRTVIERLSDHGSLDINFIQQGGIIEALPISLDDARTKVQKLSKEEFSGPRAIFITIAPYSELSNWPSYFQVDTSDI